MKFNLDNLVLEYENLEQQLMDPEIFKDQKKVRSVASRKKQLEEAVNLYKDYKDINQALIENKEMIKEEKDETGVRHGAEPCGLGADQGDPPLIAGI